MACGDVVGSKFLPTCGLSAVNLLKRCTPPDGALTLPGDLLTYTFTLESNAIGVGISFEDIFDDCTYVDMTSITVSAGWTVTPDVGNPCRLVFNNATAVNPGIFTCTMTVVAGDLSGPLPVGTGTIRNVANVLTPDPADGNTVELTFGAFMSGDMPDQTVGVYAVYYYDLTSGTPPFYVTLLAGAIPTGMALNPAGNINGTPTVADDFNFTLRLTDDNGNTYDLSDGCQVS